MAVKTLKFKHGRILVDSTILLRKSLNNESIEAYLIQPGTDLGTSHGVSIKELTSTWALVLMIIYNIGIE